MFESLVSDLLNRFLGTYIENLDSSKLKISIWGGDVILQDLLIKQSALDSLELPVRSLSGHLKCLRLKIPWSRLYTEKWEVILDGFSLIVVPKSSVVYDSLKEENLQYQAKLAVLSRIEEAKLVKRSEILGKKDPDGFMEKLCAQIIKNIEIEVSNIHIRYEDSLTLPQNSFAVGIILKNLSIKSTDKNWIIGLDTDRLIYKLLQLEGFQFYWSPKSQVCSQSPENIKTFFSSFSHEESFDFKFKPVLGPLDLAIQLQLNPHPEFDNPPFSVSKIHLNIILEKLSVGISHFQYEGIMGLLASLELLNVSSKFRKYRPDVDSIHGFANLWWKYAYDCVLEDIKRNHQNWSWDEMKLHRDRGKKYKRLYKLKLNGDKMNQEQTDQLQQIEKIFDVFNITLCRRQAEMELEREGFKKEVQSKKGWFEGWFSVNTKKETGIEESSTLVKQFEDEMSSEEKLKLFEAIGYSEGLPSEMPPEYIDFEGYLLLGEIEIKLTDEILDDCVVLLASARRISCRFSGRSASSAVMIESSMSNFDVKGFNAEILEDKPLLVESLNTNEEVPLLFISYETNPLNKKFNTSICLKAQPLNIIYHASTMAQVLDIFSPPKDISIQQLQAKASMHLERVKERSVAGLQSAIDSRSKIDLNIYFNSSRVILPEFGHYRQDSSLIVMTLGSVSITSQEMKSESLQEFASKEFEKEFVLEKMRTSSYDWYNICLKNFQIVIANKNDDWKRILDEGEATFSHLLQPLALNLSLYKCLITGDPNLPKIKMDFQLPKAKISIVDDKMIKAALIINSCFSQKATSPMRSERNLQFMERKDLNQNILNEDENLLLMEEAMKPSENFETTIQFVELVVNFTINEMKLELIRSREDGKIQEPFINFTITKISLNFVKKTFDIIIEASLFQISAHYLENGCHPLIRTNCDSGSVKHQLLCIKFLMIDPKNPDIHTLHESVSQQLYIDTESLEIKFEQVALVNLISFLMRLQENVAFMFPVSDNKIVDQKNSNITFEIIGKKGLKQQFSFKVLHVRVMFSRANLDLFAFQVKGLDVHVLQKNFSMEINSKLKLFSLVDCNPKSVHKEIVITEEEHAWDICVELYEKSFYDSKTHIANRFDTVFQVEVGAIRVTLLKRSILAILSWFDNLQIAKEAILNASEVAAKSAKESIAESYSHGQKIKLQLLLKAPLIFIPRNSSSSCGILLDFGRLTVKNHFKIGVEKNEFDHHSLIEQLSLNIENVKISRKRTWFESQEKLILEPLSAKIEMLKNLSFNWMKEKPEIEVSGHLENFQVRISEDDICSILSVIQGNLQEPFEWHSTKTQNLNNNKDSDSVQEKKGQKAKYETENIFKRFTLQFLISEISVILFTSDQKPEFEDILGNNEEFAEFSIRGLNIKCNIYTNFTVGANLILYDCTIKDVRKDSENEIRVMMEKKKLDFDVAPSKPVIDLTVHQGKENDVFVDLRISEFSLILYLPFLLRITKFFAVEIPQELQSKEELGKTESLDVSYFETMEPLPASSNENVHDTKDISPNPYYDSVITAHIKLEKPDIIILEHVSSMNSNCVFFHAEIIIDFKMSCEQRNISSVVNNLQIYTSIFNPSDRNCSLFEILKKTDIFFLESRTAEHESNIQIKFNELNFSFSPGTVEVVTNILSCFSIDSEENIENTHSHLIDLSELWFPKPIDVSSLSSFYIDSAEEVTLDVGEKLSESPVEVLDSSGELGKETLFMEMDCIIITLETGHGSLTLPLIKIQSDCSLTVNSFFSPKVTFGGQISCEIAYFNPRQATWEAFLEPVERKNVTIENFDHLPWKLNFEGYMTLDFPDKESKSLSVQMVSSSSSDIEIIEMDDSAPLRKISLTAKDALEFTVTKTFLQVLSVLLDSYVAAYKGNRSCKPAPSAPYRLINRTGENVVVNLLQSELLVASLRVSDVEDLILESGSEVDLYEKSRNNLGHQRHSSLVAQFQDASEKLICIQMMEGDENCIIPVKKADKRFFQIPAVNRSSKFGLVSSTSVEGGTKIVTLSGCVKVTNELESPVDVYYMTEGGTDVEYVLTIKSNEQQFLPVRAVNMFSAELFFAVQGYSISITPLQWKRLQSYACITENLQCQPKGPETHLEFSFFFSASCEVEQILWKNTTLRTLDSIMILINLKPCVIFHNLLPCTLKLVIPGESEENILIPGSSVHINHAKIGESSIKAEVMNYYGNSWVCEKIIRFNSADLNVWTFRKAGYESKDTVHLGLRLSTSKGVQHLWLYCPFWMVNKTGYNLFYITDALADPVEHKTNEERVILFSFGPKCFLGKKHANIKLKDSEWSEKFSLDAVGSSSAVSCKSLNSSNIYQISIIIQLSCSGLTKIVTFVPFYKAVNLCPYNLQFCVAGDNSWSTIEAGECLPIWPVEARKALHLRVEGTTERTGLIHFDTAHSTLFKLKNKFGGIFTEVIETEGSILLNFDKCIVGASSALIFNHLKTSSLSFWQEGHEDKKIELNAQEMIYFTWESAESRRLLLLSCMGCSPLTIALNKDYRGIIAGGLAGWATWMEGAQRYLIVSEEESILESPSNYNPFKSIFFEMEIFFNSIGVSLVNDFLSQEIMYLSMSSSGVVWEHRKEGGKKYRPFTEEQTILLEKGYLMHLSEVKAFEKSVISHYKLKPQLEVDYSLMKVFKPFNRNIRRVFQPGIWAQMQIMPAERNFHMKVNKLQIDNQLGSDVIFPVVLARVPPPKSVMAETVPKSFFELSIIMSLDSPLYRRFKYFTLLVQEFHLNIELPFLFSVLRTILNEEETNEIYTADQFEKDFSVVYQDYTCVVASDKRPSRRDFYHHLHLSPIKMHLSFSLIGMDKHSDIPTGGEVLQLFLQSVGVTLTEVQDVVFRLGFFERQNCWLNIEGFQSEVISHYTNQILKQIYVLILGLDVLGNPFGLVLGVTKGFGDLFYEPIQGAVEGPSEFAEGIFYGMRSFMGKTVGGAALAFSRITGTIGKGVASLTLDEDYQRRRREDMHKKPTDSLESFARSSRGVITGVFDGVAGVFTKPIHGAKEEGVEGFFKGVGKGVLGLVTRPASGMIDFASGSFDAIMRATNTVDDIIPVRPARYIYQDRIIRPYNLLESSGHKLLKELDKGRFSQTDTYITHFFVKDGRNILLATDKRLFFLSRNDILSQWKIEWMNLYDELAECPILHGTKVKILTKHSRRNVLGILSTDTVKKEVILQDSHDVLTAFQKITDAYKNRQRNSAI